MCTESSKPRRRPARWSAAGLGLVLAAAAPFAASAQEPTPESTDATPESDPPPTWRWKQSDRPIKVVALAGSIGAWPRDPYSAQLEGMCKNIEVKNLSKTGYGAYALKKRFTTHVLQHPPARVKGENEEAWLMFQGGLNSIAMPEQTNHHIRDLMVRAHERNFKVLLLTVLPWGDDADKRFRDPATALRYVRDTRAVVDFAVGDPTPEVALGSYVRKRKVDAEAPWATYERPDIAVNLYRSVLRNYKAPLRNVEEMKKQLQTDKDWKRQHRELDDAAREQALEADAKLAAEIPRWYMRKELRSFDHIHPNSEGHLLIATLVCPDLPENWGCSCPALPPEAAAAAAEPIDVGRESQAFYPRWVRAMLRVVSGTVD